jgi:hypothetical protein
MRLALYGTIWVALALLVLSEVARRFEVRLPAFAKASAGPPKLARKTEASEGGKPDATYSSAAVNHVAWWAFATGAALTAAHVLIALAIQYNWDHEAAVSATAAQAAEVYGFEWRGNIYVSYAFVAIWVFEAVRWRLNPERFTTRRPAATWALRFFFLLIIVNGAVVFASYPMRVIGGIIVAGLIWAWLPGPRRSPQKTQSPQRVS